MPTPRQSIREANRSILGIAAGMDPEDVTGDRTLGAAGGPPTLGLDDTSYMGTLPALNEELTKAIYQKSTPVEEDEYVKVYAKGKGLVDAYHQMTYKHINRPQGAQKKAAAKKAAAKKTGNS